MKRGMGTHHAVAEIPIDGTDDLCANRRWWVVQRVPDNVVALIHGDNACLLVFPRNSAAIRHLSAATGIKYRCIQRDLVAFYGDDLRGALVCEAVGMVEQFRLHCLILLFSITSLKNKPEIKQNRANKKSSRPHHRGERTSRGTTLLSCHIIIRQVL